jgi:trehalose 6-phosphate phosphatase
MAFGSNPPQITPLRALPPPPELEGLGRTSLFLDFDGTLVELAPAPDAISIAPDLPPLLKALASRLEGRLAIISGRSLADLDQWLGGLDVAIAGSHGGELRQAGGDRVERFTQPPPPEAEAELRRFAAMRAGLLVEPKPTGAALHYRNAPDAEEEALSFAGSLAARRGLELKRGKMVAELLAPGADKGIAIDCLMQLAPFRGSRPIFIGDDVTDEDAFARVLSHDGVGILVGEQRPTAAIWRLDGVTAVHDWLKAAAR